MTKMYAEDKAEDSFSRPYCSFTDYHEAKQLNYMGPVDALVFFSFCSFYIKL